LIILVFLFSLSFIALSTVNVVSASTSVIYVNGSHGNDANDGLSWKTAKLTIKNATATVSDGGTINIANGVYREGNIILNKDVTIKGQNKSSTIVNGTTNAQTFNIQDNINIVIQNLTILNRNYTGSAGSISNKGGTVIVKNCIFKDNVGNTGAVYNEGNLIVNGCTFTGNIAKYYGGAIRNVGTLNVTSSVFTGNKANYGGFAYGGAIYNTGNLTVTGSTFTNNLANWGSNIYNKGNLTAHFNQIVDYLYIIENGNVVDSTSRSTIYNSGGTVDAELNWWGNNKGPTLSGFTVNKWLVLKLNTNSTSIPINTNSKIAADLRYDNKGVLHTEGYISNGIPVTFTTKLGNISPKAYTVNGITQSTLKSTLGGTANVSVIVDAQQLFKSIKIIDKVPPKVSSTYPKNLATGCSRTSTIYLKFNEKINTSTYWSKIYVKNLNTGKVAVISKSISGNTLYIKMSSRRYAYNWYQVYIPKAAVKDYFNNNLATYYTFKFKTGKYPLTYQ
jgi:autotransporter family porin